MSWISTTVFGAVERHDTKVERWSRPICEAFIAGAWLLYWTDETLYWVAKPKIYREVTGRRLHREDGPAVGSDVEPLYFWHGVLVPAFAVMRPDQITLQNIHEEQNAEVRRVLLERFSFDRYVTESGALPVDVDELGTLYRAAVPGDEALVVVRVQNSTPEPDGSAKSYLLRVPPAMTTVKEALAWTFGLSASDYHPVVQT